MAAKTSTANLILTHEIDAKGNIIVGGHKFTRKQVETFTARMGKVQSVMEQAHKGVIKASESVTAQLRAAVKTDKTRLLLSLYFWGLLKTKQQREMSDAKNAWVQNLRRTLANPEAMGRGHAYTVKTTACEKDGKDRLITPPPLVKRTKSGSGTKGGSIERAKLTVAVKDYDSASARKEWSRIIGKMPLSFIGAMLEMPDTEIKSLMRDAYEKHAATARTNDSNSKAATKKKQTAKKPTPIKGKGRATTKRKATAKKAA